MVTILFTSLYGQRAPDTLHERSANGRNIVERWPILSCSSVFVPLQETLPDFASTFDVKFSQGNPGFSEKKKQDSLKTTQDAIRTTQD